MKGKIFNIQRFCTSDGPGIRTTVFLQGCPLRCLWCHNPESQADKYQLMYDKNKCVNCFRCVPRCPQGCHGILDNKHIFDRKKCIACGRCLASHCNALELSGYEASVDEILTEVMKDKDFYDNSGGGITLSGGEPFYQVDFCLELIKKAKERNLHVCMETCGFTSKETIIRSTDFVDVYLFDYKETDPEKHKSYTGVDNKLILENLRLLDDMGKSIILRCPVIPGYNDTDEHFNGIGALANRLKNVAQIEIEPYHTLGENKYSKLDREYEISAASPSDETIKIWIEKIQKKTKINIIKA